MTVRKVHAFTLIELLVVIGIIGILIAMLLPAISAAMGKAERVQAKADTERIVKAWKAYRAQYGRWPTNAVNTEAAAGTLMDSTLVDILMTRYYQLGVAASPDNPMAIHFLEISGESLTSGRSFVDPWGAPYRVSFDMNFDGKAANNWYSVYDSVIAWSPGPDSNDTTVADNIKSWE